LDVVQLTTYKEIRDWIDQQPKENYAPITVDGTQKSFEENVVPRQNKKKAILTAFSKRFKSVPDSVKESHHAKLAADLAEPILVAITDSTGKAEERIRNIKNLALANGKFPDIYNNSSSFTITADAGYISQYLRIICNLETACKDIYEPVKQKYLNICLEIYKAFTEVLDIVKGLENTNLNKINTFTNSVLKGYIKKSTEKIQNLPSSCLQQKDDDIRDILFNETIDIYKNTVGQVYSRYKIGGDLHLNSTARFYYDEIGNLKGTAMIEQYDHTKVGYARFIDALKNLNTSLIDVVIEHKKSLLFGKYMDEHNDRTILLCNPMIDFVKSVFLNATMIAGANFMTQETYEKFYVPILKISIKSLVEKGYVPENEICFLKSKSENLSISYENLSTYDFDYKLVNFLPEEKYHYNLVELLTFKLKKIYCKECVKGTQFPKKFKL